MGGRRLSRTWNAFRVIRANECDAVRPGGLPCSRPAHDNAGTGEVRPGSAHLRRRSTTSVVRRPPTPTDQARNNFNGQLATRPSTEGARSKAVINSAGHNHQL